ncbi:MAG: polysaccharide deacetylase family protein [Chlorobiota bacterium]
MFRFFTILFLVCINLYSTEKSKISFSFDDGSTKDYPNYKSDDWNRLLLKTLDKHSIQAILFVKGKSLDNSKGEIILESWDNEGHLIGNHTYNHPYYHSSAVDLDSFKVELLKADSLINQYENYVKFFRFPYLKEGNTIEKRDGFRTFLKRQGYRNGHVTIDASDWYIDNRLVKELKKDSNKLESFREYYVDHLVNRAQYYDSLAYEITGRRINHNLLLHHNLAAALFLDDFIIKLKVIGWEIVNVEDAYEDEIYESEVDILPAGESLIWSLAKKSGKYNNALRYPAEGKQYEKPKLDSLLNN